MGGLIYPVLVIDEANKLMRWSGQHDSDLETLLSFLVRISKEGSGRCHVLLVTSEFGFQWWLNDHPGEWEHG
jgi:hypothetical protein